MSTLVIVAFASRGGTHRRLPGGHDRPVLAGQPPQDLLEYLLFPRMRALVHHAGTEAIRRAIDEPDCRSRTEAIGARLRAEDSVRPRLTP
jgi:hypothetical protein